MIIMTNSRDEIKLREKTLYSYCPLDDATRASIVMLEAMGVDHSLSDVYCKPQLSGKDIAANREKYRLVKCVCSFITEDAYRLIDDP